MRLIDCDVVGSPPPALRWCAHKWGKQILLQVWNGWCLLLRERSGWYIDGASCNQTLTPQPKSCWKMSKICFCVFGIIWVILLKIWCNSKSSFQPMLKNPDRINSHFWEQTLSVAARLAPDEYYLNSQIQFFAPNALSKQSIVTEITLCWKFPLWLWNEALNCDLAPFYAMLLENEGMIRPIICNIYFKLVNFRLKNQNINLIV